MKTLVDVIVDYLEKDVESELSVELRKKIAPYAVPDVIDLIANDEHVGRTLSYLAGYGHRLGEETDFEEARKVLADYFGGVYEKSLQRQVGYLNEVLKGTQVELRKKKDENMMLNTRIKALLKDSSF